MCEDEGVQLKGGGVSQKKKKRRAHKKEDHQLSLSLSALLLTFLEFGGNRLEGETVTRAAAL